MGYGIRGLPWPNLVAECERAGVRTLLQLSEATGVSISTLSKLSHGRVRLTPKLAMRIARGIGTVSAPDCEDVAWLDALWLFDEGG